MDGVWNAISDVFGCKQRAAQLNTAETTRRVILSRRARLGTNRSRSAGGLPRVSILWRWHYPPKGTAIHGTGVMCHVQPPHVSPFRINLTEKIKMRVWIPYFHGSIVIVTGEKQPRERV